MEARDVVDSMGMAKGEVGIMARRVIKTKKQNMEVTEAAAFG